MCVVICDERERKKINKDQHWFFLRAILQKNNNKNNNKKIITNGRKGTR